MDELLAAFVEEASEHLRAMEQGLLRLESGACDADTLNAVFRAAHTIKGDAGIVELPGLGRFAHGMENSLDALRKGELAADRSVTNLLLQACDRMQSMLDAVAGGAWNGQAIPEAGVATLDALCALMPSGLPETPLPASAPVVAGECVDDCWHITVRFGSEVFRQGMDPLDFFRHLQTLGRFVIFATRTEAVPEAETMDPEACYLAFELYLASDASKEVIERVFDFVRDSSELRVLPPKNMVARYIESINDPPDEALVLGEMLVGAEVVAAATRNQHQVAERKASEARQLRVPAEKLDQLIDLVGELVISSAGANLMARQSGQVNLIEANSGLARLVEDIREFSLQLRMVKIGETFTRFRRVVRDTAQELGREVDLRISGEDTELDKSVVEKIGDPLTHLIRNAIDHGIEAPELRRARGKPGIGRIELNAYHEAGGIVVEVADDGGGLDKEGIRAKAVACGLLAVDAEPNDQDIFDLIFEPGFSTNEQVTGLSGRGVGMDVVRSNIRALRGSIEVRSTPGTGTRFIMRLPLTVSIIDGFLVGVGATAYVIPLEMVIECVEMPQAAGHCMNLRGVVLPLIRLAEFFGRAEDVQGRENVVVVGTGDRKTGIVVDTLHGECQAVVKPLSSLFRRLRCVSGSTILGSGDVALILDVKALVELAERAETRGATPHT